MRVIYILTILLSSTLTVVGQNKMLRIYVSDIETGKGITNAKVTLEGFQLPELLAQYNETEGHYYINEIPSGYNTVMAYHNSYNERGFQDINGLSGDVRLQLHDPGNVYYGFEPASYPDNYDGIVARLYVEDPYKIAIIGDSINNYIELRDFIFSKIIDLDIDIEPVNPYLEERKFFSNGENVKFLEDYPDMITENGKTKAEYGQLIPLTRGSSTNEALSPSELYFKPSQVVFYFRKKDGSKFKRFNDPILAKIRKVDGVKLHSVLHFKFEYINTIPYRNKYTSMLDKQNKIFSTVDSSKVFFYKCNYEATLKKNGRVKVLKRKNMDQGFVRCQYLVSDDLVLSDFNLSSDELNCIKNLLSNEGIGLGILDQYEYISRKYRIKFLIPKPL